MEEEVFIKYLEELVKAEKEQLEILDRYQKKHPELVEWTQFFKRLKNEFRQEMQNEKIRISKSFNRNK